jgi:secondary thiamine-phosphate synthase enzyme
MIFTDSISIKTNGFGDTSDITGQVTEVLTLSQMKNGLVTVFCPGSTAAVTTIEYEPGVIDDLRKALDRIAPMNIPYEHDKRWGDGNGFSHVRASLMKPSLSIPFASGRLILGTWQQIVFIDFDNRERHRKITVQVLGE